MVQSDEPHEVPVILPPALELGDLRTAVLYEKPRSVVRCDYVWRRTERWIDFPWSTLPPVDGAGRPSV